MPSPESKHGRRRKHSRTIGEWFILLFLHSRRIGEWIIHSPHTHTHTHARLFFALMAALSCILVVWGHITAIEANSAYSTERLTLWRVGEKLVLVILKGSTVRTRSVKQDKSKHSGPMLVYCTNFFLCRCRRKKGQGCKKSWSLQRRRKR